MLLTDQELVDKAYNNAKMFLDVETEVANKLNFILFYSLLHGKLGGDKENMRHWLKTYNNHLGYIPKEKLNDSMKDMLDYLGTDQ